MRVDRCECDVDSFKFCGRKFFPQQNFEIAACAISGFGVAHRGGFAEDENAKRSFGFFGFDTQRAGISRGFFREESQTKIVVLNQVILVADLQFFKKGA